MVAIEKILDMVPSHMADMSLESEATLDAACLRSRYRRGTLPQNIGHQLPRVRRREGSHAESLVSFHCVVLRQSS